MRSPMQKRGEEKPDQQQQQENTYHMPCVVYACGHRNEPKFERRKMYTKKKYESNI